MKLIDNIVSAFSPQAGLKRLQTRKAMALYEAAEPSRLRKTKPDNRSGDALTARAGNRIRGYARNQEQNYDFAEAVLGSLVDNIIGPNGISLEPTPKDKNGKLMEDFAHQISELRKDWMKKPEVTWEHDWVAAERLSCRAWCRDGEFLLQHVEGLSATIDHGTRIPYSVELIEADLLTDINDPSKGITQGVERNAWGRPIAYHLYKEHPGDINYLSLSMQKKRVSADKILHPKIVKRFKQARGVSIFASMMTRIEDIKDYEESERVAARIAAAMCAFIQKGNPDTYEAPEDSGEDRTFKVKPGTIFDNLGPGETIGMVDSNRPSALLEGFRDSMVRMAVSSVRAVTFSGVAKKYDGTYSAQRQELVEGYIANKSLSNLFASQVTIPVYERMLAIAVLSGQLKLPTDLDMTTLYDADARGPVMPWIDPDKEEKALERGERAGHRSAQQSIRERGGNPKHVMAEIDQWRKRADELGLVFTTDPKYDKVIPDVMFSDAGDENE